DLVGACSSYAVGETEDYTLTVVAPEESSVISTIDEIVATHPKEGNTHTEELMIANKGNEDLKGDIKVKYYLTNAPFEIGTRSNLKHPTLSFVTRPQTGLRAETQSSDPVLDDNTDYVLKYDKGVFSSITPSGVEEAIIGHRYGQEMISDLRGMKINSLDIFIGDAPGYAEAQVYGGESQNEPKDLLVSKEFKPTPNSWNRIVLDKPIVIENQDIWIAVKMKGFKEGQFCMGVDRGPAIVGGSDFVNVGNGVWWKMGNYGLDYNFCLRANLQGENQPAINWLKLSDYSFDVKPGAESKISLNFNNENLEKHFYEAELIINSNDKIGNLKKIKVFYINTAIVTGIDQINTDKAHVRYLADQSKLQIDSDRDIKLIAIYDITGSLLDTKNNPGSSVQFSLDKMTSEVVLIIQYEDGGREAIKVML
ncbi:MAG: hypothetical protein Q4A76_01680, partial [Porphyromonadaceae bacterium]|nr:hypothetical protein [Porphyromonadaceae bacterium]